LWRGRSSSRSSAVFQRCLACVCALSILLCVIWAKRQDGGITYFNSLFIFGLMMAMWAIPTLSLAEAASARVAGALLAVLAAALAMSAGRYDDSPLDTLGQEAAVKVPRSLARDAHPERAKLLIFSHDDWDEAVTVAAALNRMGIRSYVPQSDYGIWTEMFGGDHVIESLDQARGFGPFSWWRPAVGRKNGARLVDDMTDRFPGRERSKLPFAYDLQNPEESFGFSGPEKDITWTESKVVIIRLWTEIARSDIRITFRASGVPLDRGEMQRVLIRANGTALPEIKVTQLADYSVTVPKAAWNSGTPTGLVELEWGLPDSARLTAQPNSKDTDNRLLGICLHMLRFEPVESGH